MNIVAKNDHITLHTERQTSSSRSLMMMVDISDELNEYLKKNLDIKKYCGIDVDLTEFNKDFLSFPVSTFDKVFKPDLVDNLTLYIKKLIKSLTFEQSASLVRFYYVVKIFIYSIMVNIVEAENNNKTDDTIYELEKQFYDRITYISKALTNTVGSDMFTNIENIAMTIPKPDELSELGSRPQDNKELSFGPEHYDELYKLFIIAKLMIPVVGLINKYADSRNVSDVEIIYHSVYSDILDTKFEMLHDKLSNYVSNRLRNMSNDITSIFSGSSVDTCQYKALGYILSKGMVNTALIPIPGKPFEENIMSKLSTSLEYIFRPSGAKVVMRYESGISDSNDRNSFVDTAYNILNVPVELPVLAEHMLEELVEFTLNRTGYTRDTFDTMYDYYIRRNTFRPNKYNEFVVTLLFHKRMKGIETIKVLKHKDYVKLVILAQLRMLKLHVPEYMIHLMTAVESSKEKSAPSSQDMFIDFDKSLDDFKYVKEQFIHMLNINMADAYKDQISSIFDNILCKHYYLYNTAIEIYDLIGQNNVNSQIIEYDDFLNDMISLVATIFRNRYISIEEEDE